MLAKQDTDSSQVPARQFGILCSTYLTFAICMGYGGARIGVRI